MHNNTNKRGAFAKKARNARLRRLIIRRMNTDGVKQPLRFDQMLPVREENGACSSSKKRNFDCKVEEATSPKGPPDGEAPGKDTKLKGVAQNTSNHLCFLSSDSTYSTSKRHSGGDRLSEKEVTEKEEMGKVEESSSMTRLNCGSISVIGRRRAMEDALTVAPGMVAGEYEFFAAYDGHGGARVANTCRDRLHHLLEKELKQNSSHLSGHDNGVDWNKVMKVCFAKMDEEVLAVDHRVISVEVEEAEKAVGSTAVVVMVGSEELVVANCGDSRAVLSRGGVAMPLSKDHKPDRPDEKERVEAVGGRIINWEGSRIQGVLAMSRSIGDHYLKPYVISEPEVTVNKRTDSDDFLIIATDGLWDVISNELACEVVGRCLNGLISKRSSKESGAAQAAVILAEVAIAKGSRDNISIIVVDLKKASSKAKTT